MKEEKGAGVNILHFIGKLFPVKKGKFGLREKFEGETGEQR